MGDEEKTIEDLLGEEEAEESEEEQPEKKEEAKEPWRAEIDGLRTTIQNQQAQLVASLGEIMRQQQQQKTAPEPKNGNKQDNNDEVWKLAQQDPTILPALLRSELNTALGEKMEGLKAQVMESVNTREATRNLQARLLGLYGDEIGNSQSEVFQNLPEAKSILEPLLDPSQRGTAKHDQLAFLIAAALTPGAIAKKEIARVKAQKESRDAQIERLSALGGASGKKGITPKVTIDETDERIAERYGIDLKDKATRERILKSKQDMALENYSRSAVKED